MKKKPIISSLLDIDFYKFTMGQMIYNRYSGIPVRYSLKNRMTGIILSRYIKEEVLRNELDHIMSLRFTDDELEYLSKIGNDKRRVFDEKFLDFLKTFKLPQYNLEVRQKNLVLEVEGPWEKSIYWETLILSVITQLYCDELMNKQLGITSQELEEQGHQILMDKLKIIKANPEIIFCDFGTRRRFSHSWHEKVIQYIMDEISPDQFLGTSNVYFARKYQLNPVGTMAHEVFMVIAAIMNESEISIKASHNQIIQDWWDEFGYDLSIALTDTFGADFFFEDMTKEQAQQWKGLRHDSGDPIAFGEQTIEFYKKNEIDPKTKTIVFSDSLDVESMNKIIDHFHGKIGVSFGWGTNLTNDLGIQPLSLVMKVVEASGHPTVKLSDNLAKVIGDSYEEIERYKGIFNYTKTNYEECRY